MKDESLFNLLISYKNKEIYPFHMPGHKQNPDFFKDVDFLSLDVTEFGQMDNLHGPTGVIFETEKKVQKLFGSKKSFILVNGASSGIIASLLSVLNRNDKLIVSRNCHKSVYDGLLLSGGKPIYIYPSITEYGISGGVSPSSIEKAILDNLDAKAILITSPTYDGICSDIKKISEITNKYGKILIVDEAHGGHFPFSHIFPEPSINYADIVISGIHKTLPVLGQSALLHLQGSKISEETIKNNISILTTTSPSYILMGIIDRFLRDFENNYKKYYESYETILLKYEEIFREFEKIKLIGRDIIGKNNISDFDVSKLVFFVNNKKTKASELEKILASKFRVQIEYSGLRHMVALSSVCDREFGFERLLEGITYFEKNISYDPPSEFSFNTFESKVIYSPFEVNKFKKIRIPLDESNGKISCEQIIPYPPGIPILNPGELITKDIIENIKENYNRGIELLGISHIKTISIIDE